MICTRIKSNSVFPREIITIIRTFDMHLKRLCYYYVSKILIVLKKKKKKNENLSIYFFIFMGFQRDGDEVRMKTKLKM